MSLIEPSVAFAPRPDGGGSERRRALRFAGLFAFMFVGAGLVRLYRGKPLAAAFIALGVACLVYALVHPSGAVALRRHWMRFAEAMGRINSAILLGVLYLVVVTPLGLLLRVFSRRRSESDGGFVTRREPRDAKHFEHPY
jgi:hypothetical protein